MMVEHRRHSIKSESIKSVLLHPPAQVWQEKSQHLPATHTQRHKQLLCYYDRNISIWVIAETFCTIEMNDTSNWAAISLNFKHLEYFFVFHMFGVNDSYYYFWNKSLLFTKDIFIWANIHRKQLYYEILFPFKILFCYLNIFKNIIYSCDAKLNFQHHYSSLQSHMILPKSFKCWFVAQYIFLIIIRQWNMFLYAVWHAEC